ncbi:hypothetical protein Poly59_45570 [Rubripirellula reticaptiva]|uniref:Uncharacterized protein n=1 Tax=Rubripirellula reticaptiva TaxID=2528013 RepID=A0A5C6EJ87_9BACT|nr:class I SAM-dependent methyltransferase [Rubripirellula reticaptiva]TWU47716.1 hypothetical protein Poly59_45570 [Rubripirellula reticaptiva]
MARRLMGSRWYFYIPEEHLHYFNRKNLSRLLEQEGFTVKAAKRTYKPLTFDYSLIQFQEYNPLIHRTLSTVGKLVPQGLRSKIVPLPIGEMMLIAQKNPAWTGTRKAKQPETPTRTRGSRPASSESKSHRS